MQKLQVVDSHTEGEPTRVVIAGLPDFGDARDAAARRSRFAADFDWLRSAVCNEPRGFDAMVGALLLPPRSPQAAAQVVFFNNVGTLGMCVHGTIGVVETLRWLGRIPSRGRQRLETPVGDVEVELRDDGSIAVDNVESYRSARGVELATADHGRVVGDVAWGGNWFFLCAEHDLPLRLEAVGTLTAFATDLRVTLARAGIRGDDGGEIDHVELFGPPTRADADSRNFVLCPGLAYDRSPCGTGTSAKMACLAADGRLAEGEIWRQESILGTRFTGSVRRTARGVLPTVAGRAWITAEASLLLGDDDPLRHGIRS